MGTVFHELMNARHVSPRTSVMKGCSTQLSWFVHARASLDQNSNCSTATIMGSHAQRRVVVVIPRSNVTPPEGEQRSNCILVVFSSSEMQSCLTMIVCGVNCCIMFPNQHIDTVSVIELSG